MKEFINLNRALMSSTFDTFLKKNQNFPITFHKKSKELKTIFDKTFQNSKYKFF